MSDSRVLWVLGVLNLMFSPSGPVELVFLVDLRAADVCAIVIFMGVVGSDSIFLWSFL